MRTLPRRSLLAAPAMVAAQGARTLRFVPQSDVTVLDPLYGTDANFAPQPMIPLGQYLLATAHRRNVSGIVQGAPLFWNVRMA